MTCNGIEIKFLHRVIINSKMFAVITEQISSVGFMSMLMNAICFVRRLRRMKAST